MRAPNFLTVSEAAQLMKAGKLSPRDLATACARQIERLNPQLNAFITVLQPVEPGDFSNSDPLSGIPVAIKDLFETAGIRTTAGSRFFADYIPTTDAVVVEKLKKAGAIVMGKTNTHEIALGVTNVNPHYGACRNPWDSKRISGGSSGGSAVAVATGMSLAALGSDTGGSIRMPASLCGVVGLKPTFGRVSARGVFPLSWNLDHIGPLTRSVRDAAIVLNVISGYDADDPYSADRPPEDFTVHIESGVQGWRVAAGVGEYIEDAEEDVLKALRDAVRVFQELGAVVQEVDVSFLLEAARANSLMTQADGAAFHRERLAGHPEQFGADIRQRLEAGRAFTSTEYILARRTQTLTKRRMENFFQAHDLLLLPSTPITAPPIEGNDAVEQAKRLTRFTAPFNLAGLPALSVPCGFDRSGLPIGLQLVSGAWKDSVVLQAGLAYEKAADWNKAIPSLAEI